ncbi:hypothetical protein HCA15_12510 [Listeria booriae]|uniref:hypothetical protein n=2 Tax=Listeria booriae TaxID=1552123 RepID=UPI0016237445|nr:hypothetical protein [Listeria booriae]MBC6167469.1 hypothetical protein [Listeria booriae]
MMQKKYIWLISIAAVIVIILIGDKIYMNSLDKSTTEDKKIENKIAKEFARTYLTPEKQEVEEITFYKAPVEQSDATGNQNYFFYVNGKEEWKVGASVNSQNNEVWAFGSDDIELIEKSDAKNIKNLKINYWESK